MITTTSSDISRDDDGAVGNGAREAARKFERQQERLAQRYVYPIKSVLQMILAVGVAYQTAHESGFLFWIGVAALAGFVVSHAVLMWHYATLSTCDQTNVSSTAA